MNHDACTDTDASSNRRGNRDETPPPKINTDTPSTGGEQKENAPPPPPPVQGTDASYFEKLVAFIPADMVAGYMAVDGVLRQADISVPLPIYWAVFLALLALTPLYIYFKPTDPSILKCSMRFRAITGSIAFAVWVFALGGPFAVTFSWYLPVYGSLLLIVVTLAIPVFERMAERFRI